MPISFVQSTLGDELEVPTIDGSVKYSLPPGTQSGTVFRLKGKGVARINSSSKGDQYVKVIVEIPKKISDKQAELLKKFAEEDGEIVSGCKKKLGQKIEDFFTK